MVSPESVVLAAFALTLLSVGYALAFRAEAAVALQRRYAEAVSSTPPSERPDYYEETYDHRKGVFQLGGVVFLLVGAGLLAMWTYGALFVESFP
jgi:hypothetical protein